MKRSELDGLDREALIRLAEENGVARARILTRPELIDEILVRTAPADSEADVSIARGFFGLARDLVARVVERGLHLPDAATRIRSIAIDSPRRASPPAALPTVTLAQIYAAQGHTQRAVDTLRRVLEAEPEHVDARELLEKLTDSAYVAPKPPLPPEPDDGRVTDPPPASAPAPVVVKAPEPVPAQNEPSASSASSAPETPVSPVATSKKTVDEPVSPTREAGQAASTNIRQDEEVTADEVGPVDPSALEPAKAAVEPVQDAPIAPVEAPAKSEPAPVKAMLDDEPLPTHYDVTECVAIPVDPETLFVYWEVRSALLEKVRETRGAGVVALRVLVVQPGWHGPRTYVRDHDVHAGFGDYFLRELPAGAVVRVAIGYRTLDAFVPFAHSPLLDLPRKEPASELAHVLVKWSPVGATPVAADDPAAGFLARALLRAHERGESEPGLFARLGRPPTADARAYVAAHREGEARGPAPANAGAAPSKASPAPQGSSPTAADRG
jgi:hypothetical protein